MSEETKKEGGVSVVGEPNLRKADEGEELSQEEEADIDSIVEELEDEIEEDEEEESDAPKAAEPAPAINISELTEEQLQELAARLNATPSRADQRNKMQKCKLRVFRGDIVTDFQNAYLGLIDDPENNRQIERHLIKIKTVGAEDFVSIPYRSFMQLEQVECEIINKRERTFEDVKGTTYDDNDMLVEMTVTRKEYEFDVRTPDGKELTIEGKVANG